VTIPALHCLRWSRWRVCCRGQHLLRCKALSRIRGDGDLAAGWPSDGMAFLHYPLCPYLPVVIPDDADGAFVISNVLQCAAHWRQRDGIGRYIISIQVVRSSRAGRLRGSALGATSIDRPGPSDARTAFLSPTVMARRSLPGRGDSRSNAASAHRAASPARRRHGRHSLGPRRNRDPVIHCSAIPADDGARWNGGSYVFWLDERAPGLFASTLPRTVPFLGDRWIPVCWRSSFHVHGAPVAIPDGAHGAIVAWAGTARHTKGRIRCSYLPSGSFPWRRDGTEFRAGSQQVDQLGMVPAPVGGAVLGWRVSSTAGSCRILAQLLDRDGSRQWAESGAPVCEAVGTGTHLTMASDHHGGSLLSQWIDSRPEFASTQCISIHPASRPAAGSPTVRCPRTNPVGDVADWFPRSLRAGYHRDCRGDPRPRKTSHDRLNPSDGEESNPIAGRRPRPPSRRDGGAIVAWINEPGPECNDCVSIGQSPFAMLLSPDGPRRAATPSHPNIGSARFGPNPECALRSNLPCGSGGAQAAGTRIALGLLDASPASLELFDLAGRRVWWRDVGDLGPGPHELLIADGAQYPAGIYLARLTQAGRTATARVALLR
jgi:hypothetical protein